MPTLAMAAAGGAGRVLGGALAGARLAATSATAAVVAVRAGTMERRGGWESRRARMLQDGCRAVMRLHGVDVEVSGRVPDGPAVLACNHVSWLDPLVVAASAPCAPISKLDVRRWPLVGPLAGLLGVIFHDRGDHASGLRVLREAEEALRSGLLVLNFPEGTTSLGATVLPFRPGSFGLALRAGVPVVPVAIAYDPPTVAWVGDATFVPHYLTLASRRRARARVRFGAPLASAQGGGAAELARAVRSEVLRLLQEVTWRSSARSST